MTQKSPSDNGHGNASTTAGSSAEGASGSADPISNAKDGLQAVAREIKGEVTHIAKDFADEAKKAAETKAGAGKDFAVGQLGSVADALRTTSKHLRASDSPVTEYVERAATSVEGVSQYFQTRTLSQLVNDVERYARREPAIFLGGAFFAGMLGGRFLKAATPAASQDTNGGANRGNESARQGARALPANAGHRGQSQQQGQGNHDRQDQGNKHQGQGAQRSENRSTSTSSGEGSSASKESSSSSPKQTPTAKGASTTHGQTTPGQNSNNDEASDRGGKGSGVS